VRLLKAAKVTENSKCTSLLHYGINYGCKKFYKTGAWCIQHGILFIFTTPKETRQVIEL